MSDLIRRIRRINALNNSQYEYIQNHGHINTSIKDQIDNYSLLLEDNEMDFSEYDIRMTIEFMVKNPQTELYHLSLIIKSKEGKVLSVWRYFLDRNTKEIVSRVELANIVDENLYTYDFASDSHRVIALYSAIMCYHIGTTLYWNDKEMVFRTDTSEEE